MTQLITPNKLLVEYVQKSNALWTEFDDLRKELVDSDEWHYIMSNIEQNIFLLKRIEEKGYLVKESYSICDAGFGLGSALFDIYLQSKEFDKKKFYFTGIEKYTRYIDYFNQNLKSMWNNDIEIIIDDIMNQNFSKYDIIYSYSPYRSPRILLDYYNKLSSEIKPGSLIIENRNMGWGLESTLGMADGLESIEIDDIVIFKKI
jgi:hypothetical protein